MNSSSVYMQIQGFGTWGIINIALCVCVCVCVGGGGGGGGGGASVRWGICYLDNMILMLNELPFINIS